MIRMQTNRVKSRPIWLVFAMLHWVEKYWFNLFVVFFFLHLFLFREVRIQVSLNAVDRFALTKNLSVIASNKEGRLAVSTPSDGIENPQEAGYSSSSNVVYILNPRQIEADLVSPQFVNEKLAFCNEFIERFSKTAVQEMQKFGIPASIILAQSLLASNAGNSMASIELNNFFGSVCDAGCLDCDCKTFFEEGKTLSYRKFKSAWASFRDNSIQMTSKSYKHLLDIPKSDYKAWAGGLMKAGYSADPDFAQKIITLIEVLELNKFDR